MKLVKCIVRDVKAAQTAAALGTVALSGLTMTEVRGRGRIFVLPVEEAYTIRTRAGGLE